MAKTGLCRDIELACRRQTPKKRSKKPMPSKYDDQSELIRKILQDSRAIAVVGCSRDPKKAANRIPKYLQDNGYEIIPINPYADEVLGSKAYKSLEELKDTGIKADIIDIFRPSTETPGIVRKAVMLDPKAVWLQLGISNEVAETIAKEHGIPIIVDRCIKIEHSRLISKSGK